MSQDEPPIRPPVRRSAMPKRPSGQPAPETPEELPPTRVAPIDPSWADYDAEPEPPRRAAGGRPLAAGASSAPAGGPAPSYSPRGGRREPSYEPRERSYEPRERGYDRREPAYDQRERSYDRRDLDDERPYPPSRRRSRKRTRRRVIITLLLILLAIPLIVLLWANSKLQKVDALSAAPATPGTTYLIAGSDERGSGGVDDSVDGARADVIMLLNVPASGTTSLVSIPRDTYAEIPGHGANKINAAYALGGPTLLVEAVEELSGLTVDHYVEVGFGSLTELVNAVGGVELCLDYDVDDAKSKLEWAEGCHLADGATALAFSRMRYSDPTGDIGRASRQRQVLSTLIRKVATPTTLINPVNAIRMVSAGTAALRVDRSMNIIDLAKMAWALKTAAGPNGATGTPTIATIGYDPGGGVGSTVLLDEKAAAKDFRRIAKGTWKGTDTSEE